MRDKEFCIMKEDNKYSTYRYGNLERHEVFFGGRNRQKSIDDGLVVFITSQQHRGTYGVHGREGHEFDLYLKKKAEQSWLDYYNKNIEDFIKRYHRNYL